MTEPSRAPRAIPSDAPASRTPPSETQPSETLSAARQVRDALLALAEALRVPDASRLLAGEAAIEAAIRALPADGSGAEAAAVRRTVAEARVALLRCRRLGASLSAQVRQSLALTDVVYGAGTPASPTGRVVNARG